MSSISRLLPVILLFCVIFPQVAAAGEEQAINLQLQKGGIVHLSAGIYTLTDSIILQDNTVLEGEPGTVITIPDNVGWPAWKPLISGTGVHNVTIRNIEFDGNADNQPVSHGKGWHNFIHVIDCDSIEVYNCLMHDSKGDGLRTKYCTNVKFHDNTAYKLGHDAFFGIDSQNIECFNNRLTTRTNSALRLWNSAHVRLYDNVIDAQLDSLGGNPGIQIEDSKGTLSDVEVCNNIIKQTWGSGIWLIAYDSGSGNNQGVYIHHNLFWQPAQSYNIGYAAAVTVSGQKGAQIKNNVFEGARNTAYLVLSGGSGSILQDNIITNTVEHAGISQAGTGYGITDRSEASLSIVNNCFYGNQNGNLYGCTSSGDDLADPKNHVTSSGWTWTGSTWTCDRVKPMDLGAITPAQPANNTDTDTHEVWDILNTELTVTGDIEQKNIQVLNPKWQQQKTTSAYIYLAGYQGKISFGKDSYIPVNASQCARIYTKTESTQERMVSQDSNIELLDGKNNTLIVNLHVKTVYKVPKKNKVIILGKSINVTSYQTKTESVTFTQTFFAPPVFPTIQAPNVTVTYYNGSHAIVKIPDNPGIASVEIKIGNSTARQYRLIGEIGTAENGFRSTQYNKVDTYKFTGSQISRSPSGLYIRAPFNLTDLKIEVTTPYKKMEVTQYDYVIIEDTSNKIVSIPSITLLFVIVTFGRAIILMLKSRLTCLRKY